MNICQEFEKLFKEVKRLREDPRAEIHRVVEDMKNEIDLKRETRKIRIDNEALELIERLEKFEKECLTAIEHNDVDKVLSLLFDSKQVRTNMSSYEKNLNEWKNELGMFVNEKDKWRKIHAKCEQEIESLNGIVEKFREVVFRKELYEHLIDVKKFCQENSNEPIM